MRTYTVHDIMKLRPCSRYTQSVVEELWHGRELTARQIADLDIPETDRRWALLRLIPNRFRVLFACECAARAIDAATVPNGGSSEIVAVARRFAEGRATISELKNILHATDAATAAAYADAATAAADAAAAYATADAATADADAAAAAYATAAAAYAADIRKEMQIKILGYGLKLLEAK
jgi:hypothetical protein